MPDNLYHVQDADRPMWVIAPSWTVALARWKILVAVENDMPVAEVEEPQGIQFVCDDRDLINPYGPAAATDSGSQGV
jgi:hypothetical protein